MIKRLLIIGFVLWASVIRAATGDITAIVNPDGYSATITTAGFTSGATYTLGLTGNNYTSASTPYFTVVSLGFDNTGAATTVTRQVFVQRIMRFPYSTAHIDGTGSPFTGTFVDGETVTQAVTGATAIVIKDQSSGNSLIVRSVGGTTNNVNVWTGGTSGAVFASTANPVSYTVPTNAEQVSSTGMSVQVALSDYIYQKDNTGGGNSGTAPTFTAPAGFIVNTGGASQSSNVASAIAVTQSSTAPFQKVVGNWTWPGYSLAQAAFNLRCVAFHGTSAMNNGVQVYPGQFNVACVVFTAADTHSHTATTTTATPTYDTTMGDAAPVIEFIGSMSVSTLTALDTLTCNFKAYPVVGDSNAVLDTSAGTADPTPLYGPIKMVCDKTLTYGQSCALVDPTGSDAGANTVYDIASFNPATAYKFLTIGKAASAIAAYNNTNHSRNTVGGGIIYLNDGAYAWTGSSNTYGTTNDAWLEITRATTSSARTAVSISVNSTGNGAISSKLKVDDIVISTTSALTWNAQPVLWLDNNNISATGSALITGTGLHYVTRNVGSTNVQGLYRPNGTVNNPNAIVRGNSIENSTDTLFVYTMVGNVSTTSTFTVRDNITGQTAPNPDNNILAFNRFMAGTNTSMVLMKSAAPSTLGFAIIQNVFEDKTKGPSPTLQVSATIPATTPANNGIVWQNVIVGQRNNITYDEYGGSAHARPYWSVKNNIFYDSNVKTDTFNLPVTSITRVTTTATLTQGNHGYLTGEVITVAGANQAPYNGAFVATVTGANTLTYTMASDPGASASGSVTMGPSGGRIGNWPTENGINWSGNLVGKFSNNFLQDFIGLNSIVHNWNAGDTVTYFGYANYKAYDGDGNNGSSGAGNGSYWLTSLSPANSIQREYLVPIDIAGARRTLTDGAGAYHYSPNNVGWWW